MKLRLSPYVMAFGLVAAAGMFGGGIGTLTMPAEPVVAANAPKPRMLMSEATAEVVFGADTTVKLKGRFYLRNMTTRDTLVVTYYRNDSVQSGLTRKRTFTGTNPQPTDSAFVEAQGYGQTATFKQCGQIKSATGKTIPEGLVLGANCWAWEWSRPALEPVIDSLVKLVVREVPRAAHPLGVVYATVAGVEPTAKNRTQYCSFGITKSGRRVKLANSWNIPECETAYQSWLTESDA